MAGQQIRMEFQKFEKWYELVDIKLNENDEQINLHNWKAQVTRLKAEMQEFKLKVAREFMDSRNSKDPFIKEMLASSP